VAEPIRGRYVKTYATIAGNTDLVAAMVTAGFNGAPAAQIRVDTAGDLELVLDKGVVSIVTMAAGQTLDCWVYAINVAGTTATDITVIWV
jgi:hypothetical protein